MKLAPKHQDKTQMDVKRDKNGKLLPGKSLNPKGKPKGCKNYSTRVKEFEAAMESFELDPRAEIVKMIIAGELSPGQRLKALQGLMEYEHPKLKAVEHRGQSFAPNVVVTWPGENNTTHEQVIELTEDEVKQLPKH